MWQRNQEDIDGARGLYNLGSKPTRAILLST